MTNILFIENCAEINGGSWLSLKPIIDKLPREILTPYVVFTSGRLNTENLDIEYPFFILRKTEINIDPSLCSSNKNAIIFRTLNSIYSYLLLLIDVIFFELTHCIKLFLLIKKHNIKIVHLNNNIYAHLSSILAVKMAGVPCVCHIRTSRLPILKIEKLFSNLVDIIILVSERRKLEYIKAGIDPKKLLVIYDPINITDYIANDEECRKLRQQLGIKHNDISVGIFSRITRGKGHEIFLKAAFEILSQKENKNFKFIIAGQATRYEKEYQEALLNSIKNFQYSNHFLFLGHRKDIYKIIQLLDIVVDVSILPEGLRRTVVESMLLGKSLVVTNVGADADYIDKYRTGMLIKPNDHNGLVKAILYLASDVEARISIGAEARKLIASKYNYTESINSTINIYRHFIAKTHRNKCWRILFYEPSSGFGGSANALVNLNNYLDKKIFTPIIAIKNYGFQIEKIKNSEKLKLTDYREPERLSNFGFFISFISKVLPEAIKLYFMIKKKKISLVHVNTNIISGIPAIIASKVAGIPCICHIRQTRELIKREKIFAKWVYKFIVLNSTVYEMLKQTVPQEKINIIHDGVDLKEFIQIGTGALRKEFNLDSEPVIGIIGRIIKGKGHKEFILTAEEVLRIRPNVHFVIVGDAKGGSDRYYNDIIDLVSKEHLKNNVIFTGWRTDVKGILNDIDLVVQPYTLPEGLPNILIEAMALGKPVVTTNIPGPSEIVADGQTGFLVPSKDPLALAEAILKLLDNPQLAKQMGEAGRKRVEQLFNIQDTVKKIQELYLQVLNK